MIKQAFKFLNTLSLFPKNKGVFMARHPDQVLRSVVTFDAIKVVDMPLLRQLFPMNLFPYQKMFSNVAIAVGAWVFGHSYKHIPPNGNASATPIMTSNASMEWGLITTSSAPNGSWGNYSPAIQAGMSSSHISPLPLSLIRLIVCLPISFLLHTHIVEPCHNNCQGVYDGKDLPVFK